MLAGAALLAAATAAVVIPLPSLVVRWRVLPRVQEAFHGRLVIEDWSAGWTSGLTVRNARVTDADGNEALALGTLHCDLSPMDAISGRYELGKVTIDGGRFHLKVQADGSTNLDDVFSRPTADLPDVSADVDAKVAGGTVEWPGGHVTNVASGQVRIGLGTDGKPLTNDVDLRFGGSAGSHVSLAGKVEAFRGRDLVPLGQGTIEQALKWENADLAIARGWLQRLDPSADVGGAASGELRLIADGQGATSVKGSVSANDVTLTGESLRSDTLKLTRVTVPIDVSRQAGESPGGGRVRIARLAVESAEATAGVAGDFAEADLSSLLAGRSAGGAGKLRVTAAVPDLARVAGQLPRALNLLRDVRVTGGHLSQDLDVAWTAESVAVTGNAEFEAAGRNGARQVAIAPVNVSVRATLRPDGTALPGVSGLSATASSAFMSLDAKADSLAAVHATGHLSLDKLFAQAGQFIDLGDCSAAGTGRFEVDTGGNLADARGALDVKLGLTLDGVRVVRGADQVFVDEPQLAFTASTRVDRSRASAIEQLRQIAVRLRSRSGTLDASGESLAAIDVSGDVDIAKAVEQLRPFVDTGTLAASGRSRLTASTRGDLTRPTEPIAVKVGLSLDSASVSGIPGFGAVRDAAMALDCAATLTRDADRPAEGLKDLAVNFVLGPKGEPACELAATADVDLRSGAVPRLDVTRLTLDAARLRQQFGGLLPPANVQVPKGQFSATFAGSWTGGVLRLQKPLLLEASNLSLGPVGISEAGMPMRGETLTLRTSGELATANGPQLTLSALELTSSSKLVDLRLAEGQSLSLNITPGRAPVAVGTVSVVADLDRLTRVAQAVTGSPMTEPLGNQATAECTIRLSVDPDGASQAKGELRLAHLTCPPYFTDLAVGFAGTASVAGDLSSAGFAGTVESPVASASVTNGKFQLRRPDGARTAGLLDGVTSLDVAIDTPDLAAAHKMATAGSPALPLSVTSGKLSVRANVTREGRTTTARVADFKISGLSVRDGQQPVLDGDLSLGATVAIDTGPAASSAAATVEAIRLTELRGLLGVGELSLTEPLTVRDLAMPQPTVTGGLRMAGRIEPAWRVLQAVLGGEAKAVSAAGQYVLTETLSTSAGKVRLTGGLAVTDLRIARGDQTVLSEPRADISNDLELDASARTASANSLKISLDSGTIAAEARGRLLDWSMARQLDQTHVDVDYDWAKVWPVVQRLLPPADRERWKDVRLAGRHRSGFNVRGNLTPGAGLSRVLAVDGSLSLAAADWRTYSVRDLVLPLALQNGIVRTAYVDGHAPTPARFNGGNLDLGEISLDLTGPVTRITVPQNKVVVTDAKLDTPLAAEVLGPFCPLFAGTRDADGKLSVTVVDCTNLDPRELSVAGGAARGHRLELLVNVSDLRLTSGLTDVLLPVVEPGTFNATGTIRDGRILAQDGLVTNDLTLALAQGYELGLKGTVRLPDRLLMPLTAIVSKRMLPAARLAGQATFDSLPEKIDIQFDGTAEQPQPRVDSLLRMIQDAAAKAQAPAPGSATPQ